MGGHLRRRPHRASFWCLTLLKLVSSLEAFSLVFLKAYHLQPVYAVSMVCLARFEAQCYSFVVCEVCRLSKQSLEMHRLSYTFSDLREV